MAKLRPSQDQLSSVPEWVYHGTSKKAFEQIEVEGLQAPSYWASAYEDAKSYAESFGDGVVLAVRVGLHNFSANMLVADCMLDNGDLDNDDMPQAAELAYSLEYFNGIVCLDTVHQYQVVDSALTSDQESPEGQSTLKGLQ